MPPDPATVVAAARQAPGISGDPAAFLDGLFGFAPEQLYFHVWTRQDKRSAWFPCAETGRAATHVARLHGRDTYVGVALSACDRGQSARVLADEAAGIVGLWLDLDVLGPEHKCDRLPPSAEDALALANSFPLPLTLVVHSGHGLQPWWLFQEPWIFEGHADRQKAQALTERFQATLRAGAAARGWDLDSTHDLARLLRVPGTWNYKGRPVPVRLLDGADLSRRYDPSDFEPYLVDEDVPPPNKRRRARVLVPGEKIPEHHRNTTLTSLAGTMRRRGFGYNAIRAALREENAERCTPPLAEVEVEGIAASVARYEPVDVPAALVKPVSSRHAVQTLDFAIFVAAEEVPHDEA
jgi:putative DNA primase/helicase